MYDAARPGKYPRRDFVSAVEAEVKRQTSHKIMKIFLSAFLLAASVLASFAAETNAVPANPSLARDSRCFELRTYTAAPGKLEALNARFRDHTCALFKKHGMEVVGFWIPTDKEQGAENKLIYILAHKSREAAKQSWKDFGSDPEWQKARTESEVGGRLAEKVESVFMGATDYSPLK
jgi:hypothetical protein